MKIWSSPARAAVLLLSLASAAQAAKKPLPDISVNTPRTSLHALSDCPSDYRMHHMVYKAKGDAKATFQRMISTHPARLWAEPSRFVQLFDVNTKRSARSAADPVPALRPGQVILLELTIVPGMKIPVVFEVTSSEPEKLHAAFGYVSSNVSQGLQNIQFSQEGDQVVVHHDTCYSSGKKLRDGVFYPPLHHHLIKKFYEKLFSGK